MLSIGPQLTDRLSHPYYSAVIIQQIVFTIFSAFLLFLGGKIIPFYFEWPISTFPIIVVSVTFQIQEFVRRLFYSRDQAALSFSVDAISYIGQLVVLFMLFRIVPEANSNTALWGIAGTSLFSILFGISRAGYFEYQREFVFKIAKRHWQFSKWLLISTLMQWASGNFFIFAVGWRLNSAAVGGLRAAQNIAQTPFVIYQALDNFIPIQAAIIYRNNGNSALTKYLKRVTRYLAIFSLLICGVIVLFAGYFLSLAYGAEYTSFALLLQLLMISYFLSGLILPLRFGLRVLEKTKAISAGYFVAAIITLTTIFPMMEYFDLIGIPIVLLATQVSMGLTFFYAYSSANAKTFIKENGT